MDWNQEKTLLVSTYVWCWDKLDIFHYGNGVGQSGLGFALPFFDVPLVFLLGFILSFLYYHSAPFLLLSSFSSLARSGTSLLGLGML